MRISDWSSDVCSSDLVGPGGGPAGDLYVEIHTAPHETFTRHGNDLHCTVTLPMTAAALGTTLTLPTLERSEERRVGKECVSTCRYRRTRVHERNTTNI